MKISKKILGLTLCSLISIGGNQLTLLKANAQGFTTSGESKVKWSEDISIQLSEKTRPWNKYCCHLSLYDEDGFIKLKEKDRIPYGFKFDDTIVFGICDNHNNGETDVRFRVTFDGYEDAQQQIKKQIDNFNRRPPRVGDAAYMHGLYYDNTITFSNDCLEKLRENSYTKKHQGRWERGYRFGDNSLEEVLYSHTPEGVSLASKAYW